MNIRTKSIYPYAGTINSVDLFGYVSHGVPGLEIVGMGKHSRGIKEKFIYLTRELHLKLPKRRFVLCVEGEIEGKKFKNDEFRYLELPMLLMLWSLSGHLPFKNLEDCFSSGKVSIDGQIEPYELTLEFQEKIPEILDLDSEDSLKIITTNEIKILDDFYHISVEEIFNSLKLLGESEGSVTKI